jgi:hypothetical protein
VILSQIHSARENLTLSLCRRQGARAKNSPRNSRVSRQSAQRLPGFGMAGLHFRAAPGLPLGTARVQSSTAHLLANARIMLFQCAHNYDILRTVFNASKEIGAKAKGWRQRLLSRAGIDCCGGGRGAKSRLGRKKP